MEKRKILIVEDKKDQLKELVTAVAKRGYEVLTAQDGRKAWEIFQKTPILVVVSDLNMPNKGGFEILSDIKKHRPATRVIIITGLPQEENVIRALKLNAFDYIQKGRSTTMPGLLEAIENAFTQAETQVKVEKDMLSFLTHTLRNTLSGGPETVSQTLRLTRNILGDRYQETNVYKIINNIASLNSIFASVANMLDAYKIYVNEPSELRRRWSEDAGGAADQTHLLSLVIKRTLGRLLFEENNLAQFKSLATTQSSYSVKDIRESFLKNVLWLEGDPLETEAVLAWLDTYFPVISLEVQGPTVGLNADGVRFNLLFACMTEIVYNALKYTDNGAPIRIKWNKHGRKIVFSCRNRFTQASRERSGSKKGLSFIGGLARILEGIRFTHKSTGNVFIVEPEIEQSLLSELEIANEDSVD